MSQPLNIIIVEKTGVLKSLAIKDYKEDELYKKCGFKKATGFIKQTEWSNIKYDGKKYIIQVYAKTDGRANSENKYDFPPPIDNKLFFGNCAIIALLKEEDGPKIIDLSIPLWCKIYEKLFGGFENLALCAVEDDEEEDELANIPKEKKTKNGYLKDGFVVDSSDAEEDIDTNDYETESFSDDDENETNKLKIVKKGEEDTEDIVIEDIGSELSEESYDYDSEGSK